MNKVQKKYAEAKALKEAVQKTIDETEEAFIKELGIVNEDGAVPARIWLIDDEKAFDDACAKFESEHGDLNNDLNAASDALIAAEDALIDWGLSIAPAGVREVLEKHRKDCKTRSKLIDYSFRLDARTVPKGGI